MSPFGDVSSGPGLRLESRPCYARHMAGVFLGWSDLRVSPFHSLRSMRRSPSARDPGGHPGRLLPEPMSCHTRCPTAKPLRLFSLGVPPQVHSYVERSTPRPGPVLTHITAASPSRRVG
jgi:hypothetical protein